jgi:hypothetical protein
MATGAISKHKTLALSFIGLAPGIGDPGQQITAQQVGVCLIQGQLWASVNGGAQVNIGARENPVGAGLPAMLTTPFV